MTYPSTSAERDRWILARRPERNGLDPRRAYSSLVEPEVGPDGLPVDVATLFLTNRECPFHCLMCDLWRNTLTETVPEGAIADQVERALAELPPARQVKLYNAGSFFDPRAIPPVEYSRIAELCGRFERVIVECHPAFLGPDGRGERCLQFRDMLRTAGPGHPTLEVAMGLETVHPVVLERLNKRMTLEQFRSAAGWLVGEGIALRSFILVRPPWITEKEGVEWACRSLDFAFECGGSVCCLIPTRPGNGAIEALQASGEYEPPRLESLEAASEYGLGLGAGRVFADLWDVEAFARCPECSGTRIGRLAEMNRTQRVPPSVACRCAG